MKKNDIKEMLEAYRKTCKEQTNCKDCPVQKSCHEEPFDAIPCLLSDEAIDKLATVLKDFYDNKEVAKLDKEDWIL